MPYRVLNDHEKIIKYTAEYLKGWDVKKEYHFSSKAGVRADIFAVNPDLNIALLIEAKKDSTNKEVSAGVGQLLFYKEMLDNPVLFNDVLFALAVPGRMTEYCTDPITKKLVKLEKPSRLLTISEEAWNFAKSHNIGIFGVLETKAVHLHTKFPLGLWLLMRDSEAER